ncbi:hypothetical protein LV157_002864 [Aspergillus fumigatus]|nr:hypothetical protein LV157_002864 [Aspergillus fumigatus]
MTDEQLSIALERNQSPFLRSGKNDAQYWRRYPLRTACDLRKWQQDCFARTSVAGPPMFSSSRRTDASAQSEVEADEISPGAPESQQTEEQPVPPSEQDPSTRKEGQRSTQTIHGKNMNQHVAWENSYNPSNELRKSSTATGFMYRPSSLELIPFRDTQSLHAAQPDTYPSPAPAPAPGYPSTSQQPRLLPAFTKEMNLWGDEGVLVDDEVDVAVVDILQGQAVFTPGYKWITRHIYF